MNLTLLSFLVFSLFHMILPIEVSPIQTNEVIERIREAQERIKDFSAELLQEKRVSLLKEKVIAKGKIRFKKPNRILIEFFSPEAIIMALKGETLLLYFKDVKTAERYSLEGNPLVERYLSFSKDPFDERLSQWRIVEDQTSYWVVEVLPKEKETIRWKTRLWISKKDGWITGMEIVERNGDTTTLRFSNIRVNSGLSDSDFEISLPKEVKIKEVR